MQKKKLLILGANPETVSLILKAKEMGLFTIVTDNNPVAFAKEYADKAFDIDASDVDALVELALSEKVDGVVVGVAEALLLPYAEVCKRLRFPCYSFKDKFETMIRKDLFKKKCCEFEVPTIEEYKVTDKDIKYPIIVKPSDSSGSRGITICYNGEQLLKAVDYAVSFSNNNHYLIERYMTGDELIAYYVMQEGTPIFVGMCDRYTYKTNDNSVQLPISYIFPSKYTSIFMENEDAKYKKLLMALGLDNGSIFFQCFVDESNVVRTYEPGYRLNGAQEHIIYSKISGIDAKELYINFALYGHVSDSNLSTKSKPMHEQFGCKLSPLIKCGEISKIIGLDIIPDLPGVISVNPSYKNGDIVIGEGTLKQIFARFYILTNTKEELSNTVDRIQSILRVEDTSGNNMLISRFDTSIINTY